MNGHLIATSPLDSDSASDNIRKKTGTAALQYFPSIMGQKWLQNEIAKKIKETTDVSGREEAHP